MKFWKSLNNLIEETLPDWRDKFLSYKDLKKQLKLVVPNDGSNKRRRFNDDGDLDRTAEDCTDDEMLNEFVKVLEGEMDKFNGFFVEKEEEYVIKWKELQDRVTKAKDSNGDLMIVGREIVDFHGEMVLLENYSALNYTGLVKILKKYDKRSGALIRLPFIQKIMQQPFFCTDILNKLVKECETVLDHIFSINKPSLLLKAFVEKEDNEIDVANENGKRLLEAVPKELAEIESMESMYGKLTLSALRVLKEIRSGSSTVSVFSLPPMQTNAAEKDQKQAPVLEQAAK